MIVETSSWIRLVAKDHRVRGERIAGKWLCFGPTSEMHAYRELLNKLVEDGTILSAKIARKDPATDPFPHKPDCVICVYTTSDRTESERVRAKLVQIGLKPAAWKSEERTKTDWQPEGTLALEAKMAREVKAGRAVADAESQLRWDVFISKSSKDAAAARTVYDYLTARGLKVFLSEVSIVEKGQADFGKAIEHALDECQHLVVVTSSKENLESQWVDAEWRTFLNELRSGRKKGNVLTVIAGDMSVAELPLSLRPYQVERLDENGLRSVAKFVAGRKA